jgi:HK97 family phage portal protein
MTLTRLRGTQVESRTARPVEQRALSPYGYGLQDPSAIPPPGLNQMSRAGVMVTPATLLQVDVVFTSLRIIDNHVMRMGNLRAYTEKMWGPDNVNYRLFLKNQPAILTDTWGGRMTQSDGMSRTVWSMGLFAEAFWYVLLRDRLALPEVLDVLHPAFMEVKTADAMDVARGHAQNVGDTMYIYGTGQDKRILDPDDVVHIRGKSLPQSRRPLSPIEYVGVAGALAMAAYEFGSAWFAQGASPDFILSTDAKLGTAEVERIAQRFTAKTAGLVNAHRTIVLDSGLKAEEMMISPDKAQYTTTLEYARSVIGSWFGINEEWIGNALQKAAAPIPGAFQEQEQRFNLHTMTGYLVPIKEAMETRVLAAGVKCAFMEEELERPNAAAQSQLVTALRTSQSYGINDTRVRIQRIPPVKGGDDVIAPLASNVAPSQTDSSKPPDPAEGTKPTPDKEG